MEQSSAERRQFNAMMVERIRAQPPQPYREATPVLRVITVPGRRSGLPRPFPISVTQFNGNRYVCASSRNRDWVRNLTAAGRCRVEGDEPADYTSVLVDVDEAAEVLSRYLHISGYHADDLPFDYGAPVEEIRQHIDCTAVFRLDLVVRRRSASGNPGET